MKLKDELGMLPRALYVVVGLTLAAAAIASDYGNWALMQSGKVPATGIILMNLIALPLALAIIVWACIGRHREWHVADGRIRVRLLSLTSWRKTHHILAEDISAVIQESYDYERKGSRIAHGWIVTLKDGRRLVSPKSFDAEALNEARLRIESYMRQPLPQTDPLAESSRANGLS
ncbi:hypothetical protein [Asticcacaulis sp. 201]|uniref:hypothetical protein n=1 Tax=Asticcacaulis sp. 201 TaxID=3028787 RepID=UPI00291660FD|nr:hypothetical protein [Asticcacaulis sp. 201]MDV6329336.1 hypothetical protein [Asticcacaulis sp. 201]